MQKIKALPLIILAALMLAGCENELIALPPETAAPTETGAAPAPVIQTAGEATYYSPEFYDAKGTGMKRPTESIENLSMYSCGYPFGTDSYRDGEGYIEDLKNEVLKGDIKAWIAEARKELEAEIPELDEIYRLKGHTAYGADALVDISTQVTNGYISIIEALDYQEGAYDCRCAVFDLYTGRKMEFSDLFYEGEDFLSEINALVYNKFNSTTPIDGLPDLVHSIKREFFGLTSDCIHFTATSLIFPEKNPYIADYASVPFLEASSCAVNFPRSMEGIFDGNVEIAETTGSQVRYTQPYTTGNVIVYSLLESAPGIPPEKVAEINNYALGLLKDVDVKKALKERYDLEILDSEDFFSTHSYYDGIQLGVRVNSRHGGYVEISVVDDIELADFAGVHRYIDLKTLKPLGLPELMERFYGDEWRERCKITLVPYSDDEISGLEPPDFDEFHWYDIRIWDSLFGMPYIYLQPPAEAPEGYDYCSELWTAAWK